MSTQEELPFDEEAQIRNAIQELEVESNVPLVDDGEYTREELTQC